MKLTSWTFVFVAAAVIVAAVGLHAQDRMPMIPQEKMNEAQKKAVAEYKAIRKVDLAGPPWSVLLRVPDLVVPSLEMRLHNLNNGALNRELTELAILTAARHFTNNYEWNAHVPLAKTAGLSGEIIAGLTDGRRPDHMSEDEALVYDFCTEVLHNQSVSDPTYARMLAKFGEPGIVEAASLEGY